MPNQAITVDLPEDIYLRLRHVAEQTEQPLEDILFQSIQGNLPPSPLDAPAEMQLELVAMLKADNEILWKIARSSVPPVQWRRHQELLEKNQEDTLTDMERIEIEQLRAAVDEFILLRSYALAILKWRGFSISSSETPSDN
jgi:hypothetical protein